MEARAVNIYSNLLLWHVPPGFLTGRSERREMVDRLPSQIYPCTIPPRYIPATHVLCRGALPFSGRRRDRRAIPPGERPTTLQWQTNTQSPGRADRQSPASKQVWADKSHHSTGDTRALNTVLGWRHRFSLFTNVQSQMPPFLKYYPFKKVHSCLPSHLRLC